MKKTEEASSTQMFTVDSPSNDPYLERILTAAAQLFKESGLENVSMHSIAKRAGIGQGSLYRRFTDKGEICSALLRHSTGQFLTQLELGTKQSQAERPALERLKDSIGQIVDFIDQHGELLHLIKTEFTGKKQLTQFEHPFFRRVSAIISELLSEAVDNEEIVDTDIQFTTTALLAVLSPDMYLFQQKVHGSAKEEIKQGIIRLFT
ncbi:TetR/AcrR family transcriptional regulator [Paenibacillus sp. GCM10012307]|uniref:TetR/AcrR family transcriptional regulator n=1 Tax=Paenibacillus roseus TaxID=2798579 RepID=A0A934IYR9_9BACL|nr:TetR/AcrR family transcriptional regulator [Paenibacillus roseus]MBJ6361711.1 TetR/AcrR family transcriptional regulator [Paenibacillus roseus]